MKLYTLRYEHFLPVAIEKAWDYFSSPHNLAEITPAEMKFEVISDYLADQKMYPGILIAYKVTPLFGIRLNWVTEITHVKEMEYFIDEQRFGPFSIWHHEHHFKEVSGGVLMSDILHYGVPAGFLGRIANAITVKKQVKAIFSFREKKISELIANGSLS